MSQKITPVILSGGSGTRLWPMSLPEKPKQLLPIASARTMLQETAARVADAERFAAPMVIANSAHAAMIEEQLAEIGCPASALVLEPVGRNTAPAIALAALAAADPASLLLIMPSDHVIGDTPSFHAAVARAANLAEDGWLITFGITPEHPETGFGYIKTGDRLADGVHRVARFIEKPPFDDAERMLAEGGHSWNGGIFLFRADAYLAALEQHAPAILSQVRQAWDAAAHDGLRVTPDKALFAATPDDSIDYAVLEKADRVAVAPVSMAWSDVGSWDAVHTLGPVDGDGSVSGGDVLAIDTSNCLIRSDGPTVAAMGVSDLIIVATDRHVLVLPRGRSQDVKRIVEALKAREA